MGRCQKCEAEGQIDSNDVFYTGSYLPNLGIQTNTNFTQVLQTVNELFGNTPALNLKGGTFNVISDGLSLVYTIPHTLTNTPTVVLVQSLNSNSTGFNISYNISNITITYAIAPSLGDTISLNWLAIKL